MGIATEKSVIYEFNTDVNTTSQMLNIIKINLLCFHNLCNLWYFVIVRNFLYFYQGATREVTANPLEGMTEEEKEVEAMKLMQMIDRLKELNTIKPMSVSKDGKLVELGKTDENEDDE